MEFVVFLWLQARLYPACPRAFFFRRVRASMDKRVIRSVTAQTNRKVVVPLAGRNRHKDAVAVHDATPETQMADLLPSLLCPGHGLATKTEIGKQLALKLCEVFCEHKLAEVAVDLSSLSSIDVATVF